MLPTFVEISRQSFLMWYSYSVNLLNTGSYRHTGGRGTHQSQIQHVAATYVVECLLNGHFPIDGRSHN